MRSVATPIEDEYAGIFSKGMLIAGAEGVTGRAHIIRTDTFGNTLSNVTGGVHVTGNVGVTGTVASLATGAQKTLLSRFLDTAGDGSGGKNATADFSAVTAIFSIQPSAGAVYRITRLLVSIGDGNGFNASGYGAGIALVTGIQVRVQNDSGTLVDLTDGVLVKSNSGWGEHCYDVGWNEFGVGAQNEIVNVRWTFAKSGQQLRLIGSNNERLEVVLKDDLTGLISHHFKVNGYAE